MLYKTIADFKQYLATTGLKQYEAAEQLGIEKGHLNRILTGKRNLTPQMVVNMRRLMGEKDIMSLEECMEKYPIGAKSISTSLKEVYYPNSVGYPRNTWEKDLQLDGELLYELQKIKGGFTYNFLVKKENEDIFHLVEVWGSDVIFYYTNDGLTYFPFWDDDDDYKNRENKNYQEVIKPDFSNLYEIISQIVKDFDKEYHTQTTVFLTYEDFIKQEN